MIGAPRDIPMTLDDGVHADETHSEALHGEPVAGPENGAEGQPGPTAAQLRRFIKSRPYVPLHELRRRFELNGELDEVYSIDTPDGQIFVGLPRREADFLAGLVRDGDIGVELCKDPPVPIVVGVFPMKPVARS
jgi:hypothetical protein